MNECCICHDRDATSPDGFFCEECGQRYVAVLVARIVLSEREEVEE